MFANNCHGSHSRMNRPSLFSSLSEGDWDLLIKAREAGNGLIRFAETPSKIRMHSHAGAWERDMHSHAGVWERESMSIGISITCYGYRSSIGSFGC